MRHCPHMKSVTPLIRFCVTLKLRDPAGLDRTVLGNRVSYLIIPHNGTVGLLVLKGGIPAVVRSGNAVAIRDGTDHNTCRTDKRASAHSWYRRCASRLDLAHCYCTLLS